MVNINRVNVSIIIILVIIFAVYFYIDNIYTEPDTGVESFVVNSDTNDTIIEVYNNISKINANEKLINLESMNILDLLKQKKYVLNNILQNDLFNIYLNNLKGLYINNNKLLNKSIIVCSKYVNNEYYNNLKLFFSEKKEINNLYKKYYEPSFKIIDKTKLDENNEILKKKIELEGKIIINHDSIGFKVHNILGNSNKIDMNATIIDFYKFYLDAEKIKNKQQKVLVENSGLYEIFNNINNKKKIDVGVYDTLITTKKNVLINISKICDNIIENITTKLNDGFSGESTKSEEIKYLYSANNNNNTLINFCKKIRKIDTPSEGGLMFKRFNKEFRKKKDVQLKKLENSIDEIIDGMTQNEIDKFNLYMARTNDQSSKQLEAIEKARDNLVNAKKVKVNLS